jgi:hypothetical protein
VKRKSRCRPTKNRFANRTPLLLRRYFTDNNARFVSATTRPVSANQLFSIPVRSELCVKCSAGPGQLNTSAGVTACIALASTGGVEGSFFTAQRCSPWLSRHSHGDSNVIGSAVAAALQRNAIAAIVNVARVIAPVHITLSLSSGEQTGQNPIARSTGK